MERQIVCFGIPRFPVALARLDDPTLRTRPVAVAFAHTSRAIIHEASPEAEEAGVVPGLQADQAQRRCPLLRLVPPNPTRVAQAHHALMPFIRAWLQRELDKVFPAATDLVDKMKLEDRYKDVTFETLNQSDFLEAVKKAFPLVDWDKAYSEFQAAGEANKDKATTV